MRSRTLALLVALAAATVPLTGCISGSAQDGPSQNAAADAPPVAETDYATGLAKARDAARAWRSDAVLAAASAAEGVPADLEDPPFLYDTRDDPAVGNGLSLAWTYVFRSPGAEGAFVASVTGNGELDYAREVDAPHGPYFAPHGAEGIPMDGVIASATAAATLAGNATAREFVEAHPVSAVRLALVNDGDGPAWFVHRFTATGFMLFARVDAVENVLTDLEGYPNRMREPECMDCRDIAEPTPPAKPDDFTVEKTVTLNAFDSFDDFEFETGEGIWAVNVTVTAEVPGTDPVDARTLRVYDPEGFLAGEESGTGTLTIRVKEYEGMHWGRWFVTIGEGMASPMDQEVTLRASVQHGEFLGWRNLAVDGGSGSVGFRQTEDHEIQVHEGVTEFQVRIQLGSYYTGPFTGSPFDSDDVTFELFGPDGESLGAVGKGGEMTLASADGIEAGTYVLRATAGDTNLFGTSYWYQTKQTLGDDWR